MDGLSNDSVDALGNKSLSRLSYALHPGGDVFLITNHRVFDFG